MPLNRTLLIVCLLLLGAGCAVAPPPEPPALANSVRDQIGHLAIREPSIPKVSLADDLDGKGKAAGKTAVAAGMGWLNGTFEAAGSGGDGAALVAIFGLVTTPIVAAGGAMYGAAAADNPEAVETGNAVLTQTIDFAPAQLQQALAEQFGEQAPVAHEFVPAEVSNSELLARGFDSVLDIDMERIASHRSPNGMHVSFETVNRINLTSLHSGQQLASRFYLRDHEPRSVSSWASNAGGTLSVALDESFAAIAEQVTEEFFTNPPIRVKGLEPVSRSAFGVGTIPGTRPLFVWAALDGGSRAPEGGLEYELLIESNRKDDPIRYRTAALRYVPDQPLQPCRTYSWRVRAHYQSFGTPTATEWTPEYRFRTSCRR